MKVNKLTAAMMSGIKSEREQRSALILVFIMAFEHAVLLLAQTGTFEF